MKGTVVVCLQKLITENAGKETWTKIVEESGLKPNKMFFPVENLDDSTTMNIIKNSCAILKISLAELADSFGDFWMTEYAPVLYKSYFRKTNNAKDFILNMDLLHKRVTQTIENAQPPQFIYEWENENSLLIQYQSKRNMIDFAVGMLKGVGTYFQENISVSKTINNQIRVIFPD